MATPDSTSLIAKFFGPVEPDRPVFFLRNCVRADFAQGGIRKWFHARGHHVEERPFMAAFRSHLGFRALARPTPALKGALFERFLYAALKSRSSTR